MRTDSEPLGRTPHAELPPPAVMQPVADDPGAPRGGMPDFEISFGELWAVKRLNGAGQISVWAK